MEHHRSDSLCGGATFRDTPPEPPPRKAPCVLGESGEVLFGLLRPKVIEGHLPIPGTNLGAKESNEIALGLLYMRVPGQDFKWDDLLY